MMIAEAFIGVRKICKGQARTYSKRRGGTISICKHITLAIFRLQIVINGYFCRRDPVSIPCNIFRNHARCTQHCFVHVNHAFIRITSFRTAGFQIVAAKDIPSSGGHMVVQQSCCKCGIRHCTSETGNEICIRRINKNCSGIQIAVSLQCAAAGVQGDIGQSGRTLEGGHQNVVLAVLLREGNGTGQTQCITFNYTCRIRIILIGKMEFAYESRSIRNAQCQCNSRTICPIDRISTNGECNSQIG